MATTKQKGDLAELKVAGHLLSLGYRLALPFGEDWDFDLVLYRQDEFERVQVKHVRSDGHVVAVKCLSHSLTNGQVRQTKRYTARTIDWIAVYDATTDRCFYVPARMLGRGRSKIHLRLTPAQNGQQALVNDAADFVLPDRHH